MITAEDRAAAEPDHITFGRCRSGKRWFWYASARAFGHDRPHCGDPACSPGLTRHDYGWEDTEQAALDAMCAADPPGGQALRRRDRPPHVGRRDPQADQRGQAQGPAAETRDRRGRSG